MFKGIKASRARYLAEAKYRAMRLEQLIRENDRRRAELAAMRECSWCVAMGTPEQHESCGPQAPDPTRDEHRAFS